MNGKTVYCPGGSISQTGAAAIERYPKISIIDCGQIPDVPPQLDQNAGPYVIPIWNSHQGEIGKAEYVWNHIQESKIKITDLWGKKIEFWLVRRADANTPCKKVGSVTVAKTQCSSFLETTSAELVGCALTTVAFKEFRDGAEWDGVLVAPDQGVEDGYSVVDKKTANPNNFTSFVRFIRSDKFDESVPSNSWLTGVTMPSFSATMGDAEQAFFDAMLSSVTDISDIPKLIFVLKRTANVGLLFEGTRLYTGDLLDAEEQERGEIEVYEAAGKTEKMYTAELGQFFRETFSDLSQGDFILHRGVNTCLFLCPPLALYTHGYTVETVEPVVRFYIHRLFQRLSENAKCTAEQDAFFERHREAWEAQGSDFIKFTVVTETGTAS